jgi:hypothetical protein
LLSTVGGSNYSVAATGFCSIKRFVCQFEQAQLINVGNVCCDPNTDRYVPEATAFMRNVEVCDGRLIVSASKNAPSSFVFGRSTANSSPP